MIKTMNASPIICALKGVIAAFLSSVALLLITSKILMESNDLEMLTQIIPKIVQVVSGFVGGLIAGRCSKERSFLSGMITGLTYSAIIILGSLISGDFSFVYSVICAGVLTLISMLGSVIGTPKEKSQGQRRKAMMKKMRV